MSGDVRAQILGLVPDPMDRVEAAGLLDDVLPPAGLPAALCSVQDVARVCEAAGLAEQRDAIRWADEHLTVSRPYAGHTGQIDVVTATWCVQVEMGAPSAVLAAAIQAARGGEESSVPPKPAQSRAAHLSRDDRTDLITTAIENAAECADITVTVREADDTEAPLRRLARCLDGAGLIDHEEIQS